MTGSDDRSNCPTNPTGNRLLYTAVCCLDCSYAISPKTKPEIITYEIYGSKTYLQIYRTVTLNSDNSIKEVKRTGELNAPRMILYLL